MCALRKSGSALKHASDELKADRNIALMAVEKSGLAFEYVSQSLKSDSQVALVALKSCEKSFKFVTDDLKSDKRFIMAAVKMRGAIFRHVSNNFYDDFDVAISSVESCGSMLRCASDRLRNNREVVKVAVNQDGDALRYASPELRKDRELNLIAAKTSNKIVSKATSQFNGDREIVLVAVIFKGTLEYVSQELQNDVDVVMRAVLAHGEDIQYASDELKNNSEIVIAAVKQNGNLLEYASDELQNNFAIVLTAVNTKGRALMFASDTIKNNREIVSIAIKNDFSAFAFASETLRNDADLVKLALKGDYPGFTTLTRTGDELRHNTTFMLEMMENRTNAAFALFVNTSLINDFDFMKEVVKYGSDFIRYSDKLLKNRDFAKVALSITHEAFPMFSEDIRGDREIVQIALQSQKKLYDECSMNWSDDWGGFRESQIMGYVTSYDISDDFNLCLQAVRIKGNELEFISHRLCNNIEIVASAVLNYAKSLAFASSQLRHGGLNRFAQSNLMKYDMKLNTFRSTVLFALKFSSSFSSNEIDVSMNTDTLNKKKKIISDISVLNRLGEEALLDFTKNLARFIGVQWGSSYNMFKKLEHNINQAMCS